MQYGICHLSIVPLRFDPSDPSEMVTQILYGEHFKILDSDFNEKKPYLAGDLVEFITTDQNELIPIPLGSSLNGLRFFNHTYEGHKVTDQQPKEHFVETAYMYLNAPYLWGGKTTFGIDCSGFTQMVYKLNGYKLLRDASQQATQGVPLSFIEESEPGDLAFFDNEEGNIIHVGIVMKDNYIIHAHGKVRIDRIDHTGIYNEEKRTYTHNLRVLKRVI